jgi:tripartite-type tricarboxylate transporter receptor subunit TctC
MGQKLGDLLGQTVVIDNRPGSGGVIGTNVVAKAAPDGYTILHSGITTHGIGPHLYTNLPYDPIKAVVPIVLAGSAPVFLMAYAQEPVKSVADVIALAKAKPAAISFGSPGTGSAPHLVGELFKIVTGIPSQHIPYKGSGTGAPALASGEVPVFFDAIAGHQAFVRTGRVRPHWRSPRLGISRCAHHEGSGRRQGGWQRVVRLAGARRHARLHYQKAQHGNQSRARHARRERPPGCGEHRHPRRHA